MAGRVLRRARAERIDRRGCTKTQRDDPFADVSGSNCAHHIVAASRRDEGGGRQSEFCSDLVSHRTHRAVRVDQLWQSGEELPCTTINEIQSLALPSPGTNVEKCSSRSIPEFGAHLPSKPKV